MTPEDVLQAIVRALQNSTAFDGGSTITHEADLDGEDNRLVQPWVELTPIGQVRATEWDSDRVGFTTDDSGDRTGRIFRASWSMDVQATATFAAGNDSYDANTLGGNFQTALFPYENQQEDKPFPDGDGGTVDAITSFVVGDGEVDNDLAGPGLRRWRQELAVDFYAERVVDESDAQITTVATPSIDELSSDDEQDAELVWNY